MYVNFSHKSNFRLPIESNTLLKVTHCQHLEEKLSYFHTFFAQDIIVNSNFHTFFAQDIIANSNFLFENISKLVI
jgi:hypothetical protein